MKGQLIHEIAGLSLVIVNEGGRYRGRFVGNGKDVAACCHDHRNLEAATCCAIPRFRHYCLAHGCTTVEGAAEIMGIKPRRVQQLAAAGRLESIELGGRGLVISRASIEGEMVRPPGRPSQKTVV